MYKILVLFLFALSHCTLSNISMSDFSDSLFPSNIPSESEGELVDACISLKTSTNDEDVLFYTIDAFHSDGIQKVVISGSTFDQLETADNETSLTIKDDISLSYNTTYTRDNPDYTFNIKLYPTEGYIIISNITVEAIIQNMQDLEGSWSDSGLTVSVSEAGAGIDKIVIPYSTASGTTSKLPYSNTGIDKSTFTVPKSSMPDFTDYPSSITVTSTEGVSTELQVRGNN